MRRMQKFIGAGGDSKPASAPLQQNLATSASTSSPSDLAQPSAHLLAPPTSSRSSFSRSASQATSGSQSRPSSNPPSPSDPSTELPWGSSFRSSPATQYFDIPPTYRGPGTPTPQSGPSQQPLAQSLGRSPSPSFSALNGSNNAQPPPDASIERNELHKSLKAMETLLVNLDEYRDLTAKIAKVEKKIAKSATELEKSKAIKEAPSKTFQISAAVFESLNDVSSKHAKSIQREYEALNEICAKYFKRVAKEERAHDDLVESLDQKIKKANLTHEKNVKKQGQKAIESHDKYIATVSTLTSDISKAKMSHAQSMGVKSHATCLVAASTVGGMADTEFRRHCESVRKVGVHVGKLNEWLSFTMSDAMPSLQPADLSGVEEGHAEVLANIEAHAEALAAAKAESLAKAQEDVMAALRAQQMGWIPPEQQQTRMVVMSSVGVTEASPLDDGLDGKGLREQTSSLDPVNEALVVRKTTPSMGEDKRELESSRAEEAGSEPVGAASLAESSTSTQFHSAPQPTARVTPKGARSLGSSMASSIKMDRAPSASTMKSMAVNAENWENQRPDEARTENHTETDSRPRNRRNSSTAEGTVVDRLALPREDSEAAPPPSLTHSDSRVSSEESAPTNAMAKELRQPQTPDDTVAIDGLDAAQSSRLSAAMVDAHAYENPSKPNLSSSSFNANGSDWIEPQDRQVNDPTPERMSDRYDDHDDHHNHSGLSLSPNKVGGGLSHSPEPFHRSVTKAEAEGGGGRGGQAGGKLSLWEREREREREAERERELVKKLEDEQKARTHQQAYENYAPPMFDSAYDGTLNEDLDEKHRGNEGIGSYARRSVPVHSMRPPQQQQLRQPNQKYEESPSDFREAYDPDRYAPAVGNSRLSSVSVNRSLSTDTTASERSFVARMKARYQAEKEAEVKYHSSDLKNSRSSRRVTMAGYDTISPTPSDFPVLSSSRRVSDMASRYSGQSQTSTISATTNERAWYATSNGRRDALPTAPSPPSGRYEHVVGSRYDSLPAMSGSSRTIPSTNPAQSASSGRQVRGPDEFGHHAASPPPHRQLGAGGGSSSQPHGGVQPFQNPSSPQLVRPKAVIDDRTHPDVCGCQTCSIRHYGGGGVKSVGTTTGKEDRSSHQQPPPPPPTVSNSAAGSATKFSGNSNQVKSNDPRDWTARRQSMPPPETQHHINPSTYASNGFHVDSNRIMRTYRDHEDVVVVVGGGGGSFRPNQGRQISHPGLRPSANLRSYEDLSSNNPPGQDRRVAFVSNPQSIR
ncbi:hypothetical protein IE53DRAFT_57362 [Violaceomyces palustris]|uniref:Uncharacterized protein n=1 Tax=Violaceomyces palustris TaxID=1673888 RepID=A0ACD0NZR0_9BASI|nr:hypothetical protein IE53DRAFT_57362 [Violaceomyces palustris]